MTNENDLTGLCVQLDGVLAGIDAEIAGLQAERDAALDTCEPVRQAYHATPEYLAYAEWIARHHGRSDTVERQRRKVRVPAETTPEAKEWHRIRDQYAPVVNRYSRLWEERDRIERARDTLAAMQRGDWPWCKACTP